MEKRIDIDIKAPNHTSYLGMIGRMGESLAYSLNSFEGNRRELAYHLNLVLTEALANVIDHAHEGDPDKEVRLSISASDSELSIRIYDQGQGFDIHTQLDAEDDHCSEGGRGVQLICKLMDQVDYRREGDYNVLIMSKRLR